MNPRVILEIRGKIKNSNINTVNRFCKIYDIEQSYGYWKGLTVEIRELFKDGKRIGKMSIFR